MNLLLWLGVVIPRAQAIGYWMITAPFATGDVTPMRRAFIRRWSFVSSEARPG